jgi:hypothetical protein
MAEPQWPYWSPQIFEENNDKPAYGKGKSALFASILMRAVHLAMSGL